MRDARLNQIGEGANDVLRAFIAMVGIKPVADKLLAVKNALSHPFTRIGTLLSFGGRQLLSRFTMPEVPVPNAALRPHGPATSAVRSATSAGPCSRCCSNTARRSCSASTFRNGWRTPRVSCTRRAAR